MFDPDVCTHLDIATRFIKKVSPYENEYDFMNAILIDETEIIEYKNNFNINCQFLKLHKQYSFKSDYALVTSMQFILYCSDFFENFIRNMLVKIASFQECELINSLYNKNNIIMISYNKLFDIYQDSSIDSFVELFGNEFSKAFKDKYDEYRESIEHFLFIEREKNKIIESNFIHFNTTVSVDDIYNKFEKIKTFWEEFFYLVWQVYQKQIKKNKRIIDL